MTSPVLNNLHIRLEMLPKDLLKDFDQHFNLSLVENEGINQNKSDIENVISNEQSPHIQFDQNIINPSISLINDSAQFSQINQSSTSGFSQLNKSKSTSNEPPTLDDIADIAKYRLNVSQESKQSQMYQDLSIPSGIPPISPEPQKQREPPKQFSVPSFSFSSQIPSTLESEGVYNSPMSNQIENTKKIDTKEILKAISDLKASRITDAETLKNLMTENTRLRARLAVLEHSDVRVAEIAAKAEQILKEYLDGEAEREQQAAQIIQLKQQVIILKSRCSNMEVNKPRKPRVQFQ